MATLCLGKKILCWIIWLYFPSDFDILIFLGRRIEIFDTDVCSVMSLDPPPINNLSPASCLGLSSMSPLLSEFRGCVGAGRCCGRNDSNTVMITVLHNTSPRQHDDNSGGHDAGVGDFIILTWIKDFVSLSGTKERSHAEAMQRQDLGGDMQISTKLPQYCRGR